MFIKESNVPILPLPKPLPQGWRGLSGVYIKLYGIKDNIFKPFIKSTSHKHKSMKTTTHTMSIFIIFAIYLKNHPVFS